MKPFENIVGKGENAGNQHFLLFQQYFFRYQRQVRLFHQRLNYYLRVVSIFKRQHFASVLTLSPSQVLDSIKLKELADDNFKFDKIADSPPNGEKALWKKEKFRTIFPFS